MEGEYFQTKSDVNNREYINISQSLHVCGCCWMFFSGKLSLVMDNSPKYDELDQSHNKGMKSYITVARASIL